MKKTIFRIGETQTGKPVKIDLDTFIHTRAALLANSGGGKTTAMYTMIEQTADTVQWIIIDPEGEYSPLREMFPNMLLISKEGELPVDLKSAKLLARKIMELRISTIVDLYSLVDLRAPWVADFVNALVNLPKDLWYPVIVAIDEGHRLAPEIPTGNKIERDNLYRSRKAVITLADSGRKQHRGAIIASQRVSKMAADARAELRNRFVGLTVQDLDRDRAANDLGFSKAQARELRDLKPGQFYVYGPAFVGISGIELIQVDLSKTTPPRTGQKDFDVPPASDALRRLIEQMGDLPKQAEEETNTLKVAQAKIVELENKLRARPIQLQPKTEKVIERIEIPILKDSQIQSIESLLNSLSRLSADSTNLGSQIIGATRELGQTLQTFTRSKSPSPTAQIPRAAIQPKIAKQIVTNGELRGGDLICLNAIAQYPDGVTPEQLTVLTGYKRSSRNTFLQHLSQQDLTEKRNGRIVATQQGIEKLGGNFHPLPTGQELIDYWLNHLSGGQKTIFDIAQRNYPNEVDFDILDSESGYERSSRNTFIQKLAARELITKSNKAIRASDHLYR